MTEALLHGSMALVFTWIVLGGLGVPLPEDLALLATGALIYHGRVSPEVALAVVFLGVLGGDVVLFLIARRLGPAAFERRLFRRLLPPPRRLRIARAYQRYGGRIVFLARHLAGVRAAAFAMAGIHGMRLRRFVSWDALAAMISVPVMVGLGYAGALHLDRVRADVAELERFGLLAAILTLLCVLGWRRVRRRRDRARSPSIPGPG